MKTLLFLENQPYSRIFLPLPNYRSAAAGIFIALGSSGVDARAPDVLTHSLPAPIQAETKIMLLGDSVDIDGPVAVAGAPYSTVGSVSRAGAVVVYDFSSPSPQEFVISNPSPDQYDSFGEEVAVSGSIIVVGDPDSNSETGGGSAYVYDLSSSSPNVPILTLQNPSAGLVDYFGKSVSIDGSTVVVGGSGSAWVYDLTSVEPATPIELPDPSGQSYSSFGHSVAIEEATVVIGSPYYDVDANWGVGRAYVFDLNSGSPQTPTIVFEHPSQTPNGTFGYSVALCGDVVLVGSPDGDYPVTGPGQAFVFDVNSSNPQTPINTIENPSPELGDKFGKTVGISGSVFVVGSNDNTNANNAGSAYIYDLFFPQPSVPVAVINNPSAEEYDYFGRVAISDSRVIVGTPRDDETGTDSGTVYLYGRDPSPVRLLPNGFVDVFFKDVPPGPHDIERCDDLDSWAPMMTLNPDNLGHVSYFDTSPLSEGRSFYRLKFFRSDGQ